MTISGLWNGGNTLMGGRQRTLSVKFQIRTLGILYNWIDRSVAGWLNSSVGITNWAMQNFCRARALAQLVDFAIMVRRRLGTSSMIARHSPRNNTNATLLIMGLDWKGLEISAKNQLSGLFLPIVVEMRRRSQIRAHPWRWRRRMEEGEGKKFERMRLHIQEGGPDENLFIYFLFITWPLVNNHIKIFNLTMHIAHGKPLCNVCTCNM